MTCCFSSWSMQRYKYVVSRWLLQFQDISIGVGLEAFPRVKTDHRDKGQFQMMIRQTLSILGALQYDEDSLQSDKFLQLEVIWSSLV